MGEKLQLIPISFNLCLPLIDVKAWWSVMLFQARNGKLHVEFDWRWSRTLTAPERKDGGRQELSEGSMQQSRPWILCLQALVPFEILLAARSREGLEAGHYEEDCLHPMGPGLWLFFLLALTNCSFVKLFSLCGLACLCAWLFKKKEKKNNSHKRKMFCQVSAMRLNWSFYKNRSVS